jgi:hypothetical protein
MTLIILLLSSVLLLALVVELAREIRADGYGHRPPPRSRADESESRSVQLARLAG